MNFKRELKLVFFYLKKNVKVWEKNCGLNI